MIISSYGISHKSTWDVYNFIWNFIYEIFYQNQHFIWNFTWSILLEISFFVIERCLVAGDIIELFRCSYANNNVVMLKSVDLRWSADTNTWLSYWAVNSLHAHRICLLSGNQHTYSKITTGHSYHHRGRLQCSLPHVFHALCVVSF